MLFRSADGEVVVDERARATDAGLSVRAGVSGSGRLRRTPTLDSREIEAPRFLGASSSQRVRVETSQLGRFVPCDRCGIDVAIRRAGSEAHERREISGVASPEATDRHVCSDGDVLLTRQTDTLEVAAVFNRF